MIAKPSKSKTTQVRALVLAGWGDQYIADKLGFDLTAVIRIRRALAKPAEAEPPSERERQSARGAALDRSRPIHVNDTSPGLPEPVTSTVSYVWPGKEFDPLPGMPLKLLDGRLTRREREVLAQVLNGLSNARIAKVIDAGEATVRAHMKNMRDKLGVTRNEQLFAVLAGCEGMPFETADAERGRPCRAR